MTRPRLLILSFSNISADARVLKQVRLFADDYEVTTLGYGPTPDPRVTHLNLADAHGIRRWKRSDLILRRFEHVYWNQPAIVHARAALASQQRFDVVLANDVDAVGLALSLEPVHGVHADIHEYAPRQNEEILVWRVFIAPFVRWMCRRFLPRVASMTTVGQGLADEYLRVFGLHAEIVTNATPYADYTPSEVGESIRLVHSGASLRNRRLETLIDAVAATRTDLSLDMYLMGNDPAYVEELRERAAGSTRIRVLPPLPYSELVSTLNKYDVGVHLIPPTNFNNHWSLANKFFDYTQARLGLVIGPSPEMAKLLNEHNLGVVTSGFEVRDLVRALDSLTPEDVKTWKSSAAAAAYDLSAETQVVVWQNAIASLLPENTR